MAYALPARADVFFTPGSLGELTPVVSATCVEKFEVNTNSALNTRPETRPLPFLTLSDHYGVAFTLHCLNTMAWHDSAWSAPTRSVARRKSGPLLSRTVRRVIAGTLLLVAAVCLVFLICRDAAWMLGHGRCRDLLEMGATDANVIFAVGLALAVAWTSLVLDRRPRKPRARRRYTLSPPVRLQASTPDESPTFRASTAQGELLARDPDVPHVTTVSDLLLQTVNRFGYKDCLGVRGGLHLTGPEGFEWSTYDKVQCAGPAFCPRMTRSRAGVPPREEVRVRTAAAEWRRRLPRSRGAGQSVNQSAG
jgi:hypothetical protein